MGGTVHCLSRRVLASLSAGSSTSREARGKRLSHPLQHTLQSASRARGRARSQGESEITTTTTSSSSSSEEFQNVDVSNPILALGKFNALHLGHKELISRASQIGHPCLLSFSGMSKILKRAPRPPLTATVDRSRVLSMWSSDMRNGVQPIEISIPFHKVRHLQPEDFVKVMLNEMGARGFVCGENYRFGYKAVGDADLLRDLGEKYDIPVTVVKLVTTEEGGDSCISSSRITSLLSEGRMDLVATMLGRKYRLVADLTKGEAEGKSGHLLGKDCFLNMIPGPGSYPVLLPDTGQEGTVQVGEEGLVIQGDFSRKQKLLEIDF